MSAIEPRGAAPLPLDRGATARALDGAPSADARDRLRKLAHQLEGVFLNQLFQAMRETVHDESSGADPGRDMFTSMFDQSMADAAAQRMDRGIGEALYRQLARRLSETHDPPAR